MIVKFKALDNVIIKDSFDGVITAVSSINRTGKTLYFVNALDRSESNWYSSLDLKLVRKHYKPIPEGERMLRPVGDIMLDMEKLLFELHDDHDMQHGEVLYLINGWQKIHCPEQIEEYEDGTHPVLVQPILYGPRPEKRLEMLKLSPAQVKKGKKAIKKLADKLTINCPSCSLDIAICECFTLYQKKKSPSKKSKKKKVEKKSTFQRIKEGIQRRSEF